MNSKRQNTEFRYIPIGKHFIVFFYPKNWYGAIVTTFAITTKISNFLICTTIAI